MVLGMYHLLPFLKGWEYKAHSAERFNIVRGAAPIDCVSIPERGWLDSIVVASDDAYGTAIIEYQGAELQTQVFHVYAEAYREIGAFAQDPAGWVQKYYRPNPYSTQGIYLTAAISSGWQGAQFAYVPSFKVKLYLPNDSTQSSATIFAVGGVTAITNPRDFLLSFRKALGIKGKIPPELLTVGPVTLKEEA